VFIFAHKINKNFTYCDGTSNITKKLEIIFEKTLLKKNSELNLLEKELKKCSTVKKWDIQLIPSKEEDIQLLPL